MLSFGLKLNGGMVIQLNGGMVERWDSGMVFNFSLLERGCDGRTKKSLRITILIEVSTCEI